jgi:glycosyltransferase involved in cell wall biosynthesis
LIPCLNEADAIEDCGRRAREALASHLTAEVIVIDNGSDECSGNSPP